MTKILAGMRECLPQQVMALLQEIGAMAVSRGEKAYLVGGTVRDIRLQQGNLDIDIAVEGKAISLANRIASAKQDMQVKAHPRFGTATLFWGDLTLDLVTARTEVYRHPGALPIITPGTIDDDLRRRDFTLNAMAVRLSPASFGELLDPHGGMGDLEDGLIRALHRDSFTDDPTRILRAIRYEQRLGFRMDQATGEMVRRDVSCLETVTGERLWNELALILREARPEDILCRADDFGVLAMLCPSVKADEWLAEKFSAARESSDEVSGLPSVYLSLLAWRMCVAEIDAGIGRLKMPGWAARAMRDAARLSPNLAGLATPDIRPRDVYYRVCQYSPEVIRAAAIASATPLIRERLACYLDTLRHMKTSLNGTDLQRMGVDPGKNTGELLRALLEARLDGTITSREQEIDVVGRLTSPQG